MEYSRGTFLMARPGITYQDVVKTAQQLVGQGKIPTIESIRRILGTGSTTTIAPYLRDWKARQNQTQQLATKEKIPEELVSLLKGLWERVMDQAEEKIQHIREKSTEEIHTLRQKMDVFSQEHQRTQKQYHQLQQHHQALSNDKLSLEQAIIRYETQQSVSQNEFNNLNQRLKDQQEHINELQRLNQQAQSNLDHYRESSREQRLKEQQQYEQQIKTLEHSLRQTTEEVMELKKHQDQSLKKLQHTHESYSTLQHEHQKLTAISEEMRTQLTLTQEKFTAALQAEKQSTAYAQEHQQKLEKFQNEIFALQKENALLKQKLSTLAKQLSETVHQNKTLVHEKWVLGQEKAQLIGQFKQLEATLN
jgi:chromosome segregation ATPase